MDSNKLRKALEDYRNETLASLDYRRLEFSVSEGKTPEKKKTDVFLVPNHDFTLGNKTMFTAAEAFELQKLGADLGLRLPRAHEWRGIGYWITHGGEYVTKFGLVHAGHTFENTGISQTQDGGAYYWSGSSNKDRTRVRAMSVLQDGTFNIHSRQPEEEMCVRLIIDGSVLK